MDVCLRGARELARALAHKEISSRELLARNLGRVEKLDPSLNALVSLDLERAQERAAELDDLLAESGPVGPLHGLPITVKDSIETAGLRTTSGVVELIDHVPAVDADSVAILKKAGAIVFGKTNTPAWADDHQTSNEIFGTTNNPWDLTRSPGGSSGGAAVAVATGMSAFDIGSDIANSIRGPASHCGIYGHKPTFGFVSHRGHIPPRPGATEPQDMSVIGPMTRTADDLGLVLGVLAGSDLDGSPRALGEFRIAAWLDDETFPVAPDVTAVITAAVNEISAAGTKVDFDARPDFTMREARSVFNALLVAATRDVQAPELVELARSSREAPGRLGVWSRYMTMTQDEWADWDAQRRRLQARWADFFTGFDVLITPAMQVPALPHDLGSSSKLDRTFEHRGTTYRYFDQSVWAGLSGVAYLPSTVAPVGRTNEELPVGLQIVGSHGDDATTIAFARSLEPVVGGYEPPPPAL